MAENFLHPGKYFCIHDHEANFRSPQNFNPQQYSPRYIIIKLSKSEDKDFFLGGGGKIVYLGS